MHTHIHWAWVSLPALYKGSPRRLASSETLASLPAQLNRLDAGMSFLFFDGACDRFPSFPSSDSSAALLFSPVLSIPSISRFNS
jgi:hypothetical protein